MSKKFNFNVGDILKYTDKLINITGTTEISQ